MKKLIALLLALVLVLSLVACTAKEEPEKEEEKPADSEQKPAEDKKEEEPKEEEKKEEEKEEEQEEAPAEYVPGTLPLVMPGEDNKLVVGIAQRTNTEDYDTNSFTLWVEEQTGIDMEFVYFSEVEADMKTQVNLMISGGQELPDLFWGLPMGSTMINELGEQGYFIDITEYFDKYHTFWDESMAAAPEGTSESIISLAKNPGDGAMYYYPTTQYAQSNDRLGSLVTINKAWLDAIGKDVPTNIDELYEVLKAFATEDPNGNGEADEMPALFYSGWRAELDLYIINAWVYIHEDYMLNSTDGQLWLPYATDEYREALKFLNKIYAEGLLSPLSYTVKEHADMKALYNPLEGPAKAGLVGAHPTVCCQTDSPVTAEYIGMGPLEGETELGGFAQIGISSCESYFVVTEDCENPDLAVRLIDFATGKECHMRARYGIEGEHWTWAEEGAVDVLGEPANVTLINAGHWSEQNNYTWHSGWGLGNTGWIKSSYEDDGVITWSETRAALNRSIYTQYYGAAVPDEVVYNLAYNAEENEVVTEYKTLLKDYIKSQRAYFVTGELDPNSDADWEAYLQGLENQGMSEFLAASQSCWDRMNGR